LKKEKNLPGCKNLKGLGVCGVEDGVNTDLTGLGRPVRSKLELWNYKELFPTSTKSLR